MAHPVYAKGINVTEFKQRHSIEQGARDRFYQDVDSGRMRHLARDWTAAPWHVRDLYRALEARSYPPPQPPTLAQRVKAIWKRILWSAHQVQM
jgi:hypothetical protein